VQHKSPIHVFVDHSHKPDALRNVLETLSELKKGKIITVFGCGGSRDSSKRPLMGSVAESYSDLSIVTNDNPRREDPIAICKEILAGFKARHSYMVELDRKSAIQKAIQLAKPNDIVLIAGKGHESYQIFSHKTIEFDDRLIAKEILDAQCKA
jgi:UDP-N-acetylmuramoyl-L-alanyl-D-glutamate--2,6-diaminopimelate ligase